MDGMCRVQEWQADRRARVACKVFHALFELAADDRAMRVRNGTGNASDDASDSETSSMAGALRGDSLHGLASTLSNHEQAGAVTVESVLMCALLESTNLSNEGTAKTCNRILGLCEGMFPRGLEGFVNATEMPGCSAIVPLSPPSLPPPLFMFPPHVFVALFHPRSGYFSKATFTRSACSRQVSTRRF